MFTINGICCISRNNDGITDEVDLAIVKAAAHAAIVAAAPRKRKLNITTWGRLKRQ